MGSSFFLKSIKDSVFRILILKNYIILIYVTI